MQSPSVLVAVSNPRIAAQIRRDLEEVCGEILHATSRNETLEVLNQRSIQAIFADFHFPDGSGLGVLPRSMGTKAQPGCVFVVRDATAEDVAQAWRLGASDIVFVPLTRLGLRAALQRALEGGKNRLAPLDDKPADPQAVAAKAEIRVTIPLEGDFDDVQRTLVHEVIRRFDGNKAAAARALGLHRRTLYRMIDS